LFAKGQTVIQTFEQFAPKHYAVPDDRIGLQLGTLTKEIRKIIVALDVTEEVVDEAIAEQADLIIAHHAIIYMPLKQLRTDSPAGKLYEKLIKNDIAVYIAHTNLDVAEGGINDMMADLLKLRQLTPLEEVHTEKLYKIAVFVPKTHQDHVLQALFQAGAGHIGQYSHCSFHINGTGTFKPEDGTNPFIGSAGKLEKVEEVRIETVVPESVQRKVVQAMLKAHPYEEVAYDLYPMNLKGRSFGLGRVGKLPAPMKLSELNDQVKSAFEVPFTRVVGDLNREIRKVAVLGGAGSRYIRHALFAGADVLVTGDIDYHTAHDALAAGLCLIDPGHNIEKIMKQGVTDWLRKRLNEQKYSTEVLPSRVNTEPFQFL
jgi:dinuclear metal center YbgI/SA1388 family protein